VPRLALWSRRAGLWGLTLLPLYRVVSHHAASRAVFRYAARRLGRVVVKRGLDGWNAIRQ
jgi:hypothetical protein